MYVLGVFTIEVLPYMGSVECSWVYRKKDDTRDIVAILFCGLYGIVEAAVNYFFD